MDTPSFGLLCARAVFTARQSAHDLKQTFTLKDAAAIIDQLDQCRSPDEANKPVQTPASNGKRYTPTDLVPAMAMACNYNPSEMPPVQKASCKTAVIDILTVSPNLTPDELKRRAGVYRHKHPDWACTPKTLAAYWGELGESNGNTFAARDKIAPEGWEDAFRSTRADTDYYDPESTEYLIGKGWAMLGPHQRDQVRKKLGL